MISDDVDEVNHGKLLDVAVVAKSPNPPIDTGTIWRRHQRVEDQEEINELKEQVMNLFSLLKRVPKTHDAKNCTLENPCIGCAIETEVMRCKHDGTRNMQRMKI